MPDQTSAELTPNDNINFGVTTQMKEALKTSFGAAMQEKQYPFGCTLNHAINTQGVMVRVVLVEEDGIERTIDTGKTPVGFDPAIERMTAQAAGDPGEYLMITQTQGNRPSVRYLDETDIDHVPVVKGRPVIFNHNPKRNRQIMPSGVVKTVNGYKIS